MFYLFIFIALVLLFGPVSAAFIWACILVAAVAYIAYRATHPKL